MGEEMDKVGMNGMGGAYMDIIWVTVRHGSNIEVIYEEKVTYLARRMSLRMRSNRWCHKARAHAEELGLGLMTALAPGLGLTAPGPGLGPGLEVMTAPGLGLGLGLGL